MEHTEPKSQGDKSKFKVSRWLHYRHKLKYAILKRDGFRCRICGRSAKEQAVLTLDHLQPLSKGGDWTTSNLITLCRSCNEGKDNDLLTIIEQEILKNPKVLFNDWLAIGICEGVMLG